METSTSYIVRDGFIYRKGKSCGKGKTKAVCVADVIMSCPERYSLLWLSSCACRATSVADDMQRRGQIVLMVVGPVGRDEKTSSPSRWRTRNGVYWEV